MEPVVVTAVVSVAGLLATLAGTVFTQVYQRRGDRERRAEDSKQASLERDQALEHRHHERWLDLRRDLYARFLRGADALLANSEERTHWILFGGAPIPEPEQHHGTEVEATELIKECTGALEEMRLFASGDVLRTASQFVMLSIEVERLGVQATWGKRSLYEQGTANSENLAKLLGADEKLSRDWRASAQEVLAAMRAELGARPADDTPGLGGVQRFPAWC